MRVERRVQRLEQQCQARVPSRRHRTAEDWFEIFLAWAKQGNFDGEPDFLVALESYLKALEDASKQTDPPFYPPDDFMPSAAPRERLVAWRQPRRYPDITTAWFWLVEFFDRVLEGVPPVTESEFAELAEWFHANDSRLHQESLPSQMLDVGDGEKTSVTDIRYGVWKGARVPGAGKLAEQLRELKARFGELNSDD